MPVRLICPGCEKTVRVPDGKEGETVKCPSCKTAMTVPDDAETDDEPRAKTRDDEAPRKRSRPRDEEDDRPRRKSKQRAGGGPNWKLYAGLGGGLAVVLAVVLVLTLGKGKPPGDNAGTGGGGGGGNTDGSGTGGGGTVGGGAGSGGAGGGTGGGGSSGTGGTQTPAADGVARVRTEAVLPGSVRGVVQGGWGNDGYFGIALTKPRVLTPQEAANLGKKLPPGDPYFVIHRAGTGEKVKTFPMPEPIANFGALSPDAKYLATLSTKSPNALRLIDTDTGQKVAEFTPNPSGPGKGVDQSNLLHWAAFIATDRLLTVTNTGGYDVWSVPELKRVGGQPGVKIQFGDLSMQGADAVPNYASLSADRKKLARFNGTGVSVVDLATGKEIGRTEDVYKLGRNSLVVVHVALSPDAKRVYTLLDLKENIAQCRLVEFDVATGKKQRDLVVPKDSISAGQPGMYFWGPDHLVISHDRFDQRHIVDLPAMTLLGPVVADTGGPFAAHNTVADLGGRLWYLGQETGKPTYLFGVLPSALPAKPDEKKRWAIPVKLGG